MEEKEGKRKSIKLNCYCPSVSKIAQIMAWEDQKLELGAIARTFGLEPSTLKLNGHFISRGVDFVASSVTWRSLLSFFSARGLSTGIDGSPALIVHGKFSKSRSKRTHNPTEVESGVHCASSVGINLLKEDIKFPDNKKLKEGNDEREIDSQRAKCSDTGFKRKHWLENISPFKKLRVNGSYSNGISQGHEERGNKRHCTAKLSCCWEKVRREGEKMRCL